MMNQRSRPSLWDFGPADLNSQHCCAGLSLVVLRTFPVLGSDLLRFSACALRDAFSSKLKAAMTRLCLFSLILFLSAMWDPHASAQSTTKRLILKDGSYQL